MTVKVVNAFFVRSLARRFAGVVKEHDQPQVCVLRRRLHRPGNVGKHIVYMPWILLGAIKGGYQLRHYHTDNLFVFYQHIKGPVAKQQLFQLHIDPLSGHQVESLFQCKSSLCRFFLQGKAQNGSKAQGAENTQRVLGKPQARLSHAPQALGFHIRLAAKGVYQSSRRVVSHGVDGKIPARQIRFHLRHKGHPVRVAAVRIAAVGTKGGNLISLAV